jgi:aryl-alcohol dehydrogenase-like predicted oxidoreductase
MIPQLDFGATGHRSTRLIFGAAALARASSEDGERALALLLEHGVNHIDTAASYGDAELRVGEWMGRHRGDFFLATKTGERGYAAARTQIRHSLERLQTDHLDLLQLHNLVKPDEWELALGDDGALRAALEARDEGLVRFVGVTGHGNRVAEMHLRSLERHAFASVLLPYNPSMMAQASYAASFESLLEACAKRRVAVQTIKAIARRRWHEDERPTHTTWYAPLTDPAAIRRAVGWALSRAGIFVNSASDLTLLPAALEAAASFEAEAAGADSAAEPVETEPLWVPGFAAQAGA